MAVIVRHLTHEYPLLDGKDIASATAGSGSDFELDLICIPDVHAYNASFGAGGKTVVNAPKLRTINIMSSGSTLTGVDTNNCTFNVNLWRAGSKLSTLATVTFDHTKSLAAHTPMQLNAATNKLQAGDVITFARVSAGTGLATPALRVQLDWDAR